MAIVGANVADNVRLYTISPHNKFLFYHFENFEIVGKMKISKSDKFEKHKVKIFNKNLTL